MTQPDHEIPNRPNFVPSTRPLFGATYSPPAARAAIRAAITEAETEMRARWAERLDEDDIDDVPLLDLPTLPDLRPYAWGALAALTVVLVIRRARS